MIEIRPSRAAPAIASFVAALVLAFAVARIHDPDVVFPKYLAAAVAPPAERTERALDYSPLYLSLVRAVAAVAPTGDFRTVLVIQGVLHAITAAAVAATVTILAGTGWGLVAGLGVASYRPFLVYAGIHEPETTIVACLALAMLGGVLARRRLGEASGVPGREPGASSAGWLETVPALALAFVSLALAGLGRPQHLLLMPVWAVWIASAAHGPARRRARRVVWGAATIAAAVLVGPVVVARSVAAGAPALMNPGPVFYEGNSPAATGLVRYAPVAVLALEDAHVEAFDYGHVAYRRIASAAVGRPLSPGAANRWWAGLAREGMAAWPGLAARRFARKAVLAIAPYEAHDLSIAESFDRRLRPWLPWGFFLLLLPIPWLPFARRDRLGDLAGPLAVAALALLVQIGAYASARQRLPMALGLWVVAPMLAADLAARRLRLRPLLALPLGVAFALAAGAAGGRTAVLDRLGWDAQLGLMPSSLGESLLAFQEGRAQRPALRDAAARFAAGVALARSGRPGDSLRALAPLLGSGNDFTVDDKTVGVPENWAARDLLALGRLADALAMARAARAIRPQDPEIAALTLRLESPIRTFRPPGCDPVSARLFLARAALAAHDRAGAQAFLQPLASRFPELAKH